MTTIFKGCLPLLILIGLVLISVLVHAQDDQAGFISIDCGIVEGSTYTDNVTKINYVSDADFIEAGEIHNILAIYNPYDVLDPQLTTLRSFPQNTRNCYTLKPTQGKGKRYLIRARFMYGNYDFKEDLPQFDIYLGPDYWDTISFNSSSKSTDTEIIHVLSSDYLHVCLVNTGSGIPFISAVELRLLARNMYQETDFGSLYLYKRVNFGYLLGTIRYGADKYDRLWSPINWVNSSIISTIDEVYSGLLTTIYPPSEVMSYAIVPQYPNDPLNIIWTPDNTTDQFFMYLHFAEIEILKRKQNREFNIYLNGDRIYLRPFSPANHSTTTIYSQEPLTAAPTYTLTMNKTNSSTLPPLINAIELYTLKRLPQNQTYDQDAAALWSIKSAYKIDNKKWQGDPCTPQGFVWDGIGCSYNDSESPRIVSLNLSANGLIGVIDPGIANLTMLHTLDLSNNNLTGTVPDFLSGLNSLTRLFLKGNNLVGPVPAGLQAKVDNGSMSLSFDGESTSDPARSCDRNTCEKNKDNKIIVPVIASVASVLVLLTALTAIWMNRRKELGIRLGTRNQVYTYSEVQSITNNFSVVLGNGGFGTVYRGTIDDTQVAVKMLSESSLQGDREFQAEAYLLLGIHHRNLISLVGYCNDENHKGIIYEYMANGNLESHLFDMNSSFLNWKERMQIVCDAAHGLDYLHHGCRPPIVHRDIKGTNILLNEDFQAKLADFGLSRAFPIEGGTHIYFNRYFTSNRLTEKSDVYSFGVVLLVVITGQPAITTDENENIHISQLVNLKLAVGDINNIVDPRLQGEFDVNSAWKAIELAMACVAHTPSRRPAMNEVVMELNDCLVAERARLETTPNNLTAVMALNLETTYDPTPT